MQFTQRASRSPDLTPGNFLLWAAFTPRQPTSSVESLTNQRLHLGRDEVSDWQDAQHWLPWCGCGVIPKELELRIEDMHLRSVAQYSTVEVAKDSSNVCVKQSAKIWNVFA
ncbi:uncharacterized protein TNCV_2562591 [Trichonephila clavipes]|uniref:Uncharacterized protein n=1 Tax=Trichonephila clavipes TaxID=2585209 RepID=A0A8X6R9M8_TRICX|nr:uncharacterized protein TNCV_2562591 [Trichonephila clavipes]